MIAVFGCKAGYALVASADASNSIQANQNKEAFKIANFLVLTQTLVALAREGKGVHKMYPLVFKERSKIQHPELFFGLYKIAACDLSDESLIREVSSVLIKQHKKLLSNRHEDKGVIADKDLFSIYFDAINSTEIKFQKIHFLEDEEE